MISEIRLKNRLNKIRQEIISTYNNDSRESWLMTGALNLMVIAASGAVGAGTLYDVKNIAGMFVSPDNAWVAAGATAVTATALLLRKGFMDVNRYVVEGNDVMYDTFKKRADPILDDAVDSAIKFDSPNLAKIAILAGANVSRKIDGYMSTETVHEIKSFLRKGKHQIQLTSVK